MKFTFTNDNNDDSGFELLEPNTYTFTILQVETEDEDGQSFVASTGTQFIKVKCCEKESGLRLTHCIFLDPTRSKKVYWFLKAIDKEPEVGEVDLDPSSWVGQMFRGKVEIKNGRNNIVATYGFSQTAPEPLPSGLDDPLPFDKPTTTTDPDLDEDVPF